MSLGARLKTLRPYLLWVVLTSLAMGWVWSRFDDPFHGHSYLLQFGDARADVMLPEVREAGVFLHPNSPGYDGQYYAQMATNLDWADPEVSAALDNPSYRARRMAMPVLTHLLSGGQPGAAVELYIMLHLVTWLALAVSCIWWFDLRTWGGRAAALAVVFAPGMAEAVLRGLPDAPGLLLLGWAAWQVQRGNRWAAAGLVALATLVRETSLLGAVMLLPTSWPRGREWGRMIGLGLLAVGPVLAWTGFVTWWMGPGNATGNHNFAWPGAGLWGRVLELWHLPEDAWGGGEHSLAWLALVALLVQMAWLGWRRAWSNAWWRLGIVFVVLAFFLGRSVWEGSPGAAVRVLAPVFLAFNVLAAPRSRATWILWAVGNLGLIGTSEVIRAPAGPSYRFTDYERDPVGAPVRVKFVSGWDLAKESWQEYWRWTYDAAVLDFELVGEGPLEMDLSFQLRSDRRRQVEIRSGNEVLWIGEVSDERTSVEIKGLVVTAPRLRLKFAPAEAFTPGQPLFNVRNLRVALRPAKPAAVGAPGER